MSILSQAISVIVDRGISAPGNDRELVDGLNAIEKMLLLQLMSTVQLLGEKSYDTHMVLHTGTCTSDVSLAREFQKHQYTAARKHGVIDQLKCKKTGNQTKVDRKVISRS